MEAFDGTPVANSWVTCGWYDPDGYTWFVPAARYYDEGDAVTAADGSFSFAGVPSHPGHDSIMAGQPPGPVSTTWSCITSTSRPRTATSFGPGT